MGHFHSRLKPDPTLLEKLPKLKCRHSLSVRKFYIDNTDYGTGFLGLNELLPFVDFNLPVDRLLNAIMFRVKS